jgi:hypothetical protein
MEIRFQKHQVDRQNPARRESPGDDLECGLPGGLRVLQDFGFYANVNPAVARPHSQQTERRLGNFFRQATLPFNGYADQVASLYNGMDLRLDF